MITLAPFGSESHALNFENNKKEHHRCSVFIVGGGHGTRTHEAVTPYSLSRRAP